MTRHRLIRAGLIGAIVLLAGCTRAPAANTSGQKIFALGVGHSGSIPRSMGDGPYATEGLSCAGCHGSEGAGTGIAPAVTRAVLGTSHTIAHKPVLGSPPPPAVAEGPWTMQQTIEAVTTGVTPEGNHLGGRMPRWRLDTQDAAALAQFLGSL